MSSMARARERVRKVFSIQEDRKKQFMALEKVQQEYLRGEWTAEQYQSRVQEVTALFSQLSRDLLSLIAWFRDNGRSEAARILEDLQLQEKEKLQMTVQYQLKRLERREGQGGHGGVGQDEGEEELCVIADEERAIRRNLAKTEGAIAGCLEDFKFECESELLDHR